MIPFKLMTNFVKLTQVPLTIYQLPFKMRRTSIIHPFYLCIPIQPLNLTYPEFQIPLTPTRIPLNLLRKRHKGWTVHAGPIGLVHWQIIEFIEWNVSFYNDLPHKYVVKLAKFSHLKSMVAWQAADIAVSMNNRQTMHSIKPKKEKHIKTIIKRMKKRKEVKRRDGRT